MKNCPTSCDPIYKGLCKCPFDLLYNFSFLQNHRKACSMISGSLVKTTYSAGASSQASPGFRVLLKTVAGQKYNLDVTTQLKTGDTAFVYIESYQDNCRLVPRTNTFNGGDPKTSYSIEFTAVDCLTWVGILFTDPDQSYCLETCRFVVTCVKKSCCLVGPTGPTGPTDCQFVEDCLCQIETCPDQYIYDICIDFLQIHLDLLNSNFPSSTEIAIIGYIYSDGSSVPVSEIIGITDVSFGEVRNAFENLGWITTSLSGDEFKANLPGQTELLTQVVIGRLNDPVICPPVPPFPVCLPTNCSQIDECATTNCENKLLVMKPGSTGEPCQLCWAHICPPRIDTCLTKCGSEDHVGILPDETLTSNASLSVGPRGSGFLSAQKPTPGSPEGGDCRGINSVDWQMNRIASDQVAISDYSVISGGSNNQTTSEFTVIAGGSDNLIQADGPNNNAQWSVIGGGMNNQILVTNNIDATGGTIAGGSDNKITSFINSSSGSTVSGGSQNFIFDSQYSSILGGLGNLCDGSQFSVTSGKEARSRLYAQQAWSAGQVTQAGDRQCSKYMMRAGEEDPEGSDILVDLVLFDGSPLIMPDPATWLINIDLIVADGAFGAVKASTVAINSGGNVTFTPIPNTYQIIFENISSLEFIPSTDSTVIIRCRLQGMNIITEKIIACLDVVEVNY